MNDVIWATPLYEFLRRCNASGLPKRVLDCGAGGREPPLSLFYRHGYHTCGVEIAEEPLAEARRFSAAHNMALNIIRGDMRRIPFPNGWFSFAYSFNAIDFMIKPDIRIAIQEMTRVLRPEGLIYVNVLSVDDPDSWEPFCPTALDLGSTGFAHFEDDELDAYLEAFDIEYKSKRDVQKRFEGRTIRQVDIEYIGRRRWTGRKSST